MKKERGEEIKKEGIKGQREIEREKKERKKKRKEKKREKTIKAFDFTFANSN